MHLWVGDHSDDSNNVTNAMWGLLPWPAVAPVIFSVGLTLTAVPNPQEEKPRQNLSVTFASDKICFHNGSYISPSSVD